VDTPVPPAAGADKAVPPAAANPEAPVDATVPPAADKAVPPAAATDQAVPPAGADQTVVAKDALADVVKPEFKATVDDKIEKLKTHINNGASLLAEGKVDETVKAYRAAADLVSPEEQKLFLQEQTRVGELIKAERLKPTEQQDAKKLEEMKTLELNLRTLGRVDIFTETNAGLIYTQTGDLAKAGEAFANAFKNEKAMVDEKLLPDLYLSKDPNLGARIAEISKNTGVDVKKLMATSVESAGLDPKLVGLDTGRGPPVPDTIVVPDKATAERAGFEQGPPAPGADKAQPVAAPDKPAPAVAVSDKAPPAVGADQPPVVVPGDKAVLAAPVVGDAKAAPEKAIEAAVVFSPTDKAGRTPLERVGFYLDQANEKQTLTAEMRKEIEAAIADADKGISPKLQVLEKREAELRINRGKLLEAPVSGTTEKLGDAVSRVDSVILGTFEEQVKDGNTFVVQTKAGLIDKLNPPADYKMSEEIKAAVPPAEYKPSTAKPADSKLSDADYRTESFRNDLRSQEYRRGVRSMYTALDESMSEAAYKDTLGKLKSVLPADSKALVDALTERDKATTEIRPVQFELNMTVARIPAEKNQSAMARAMYGDVLSTANEPDNAKKYFSEAYAWNQLPAQTEEFRTMAMMAGANPTDLLDAAVKQNENRGGAKHGKALEVENLLQEANLIYASATADRKADVANKLTGSIEKLQKMSDTEASQVEARSQALLSGYEKALPADEKSKTELKGLERKMDAAEASFTDPEKALVEASLDPTTSPEDRARAIEELKKTQGQWVTDLDSYKEILGDKGQAYTEVKAKITLHMVDVSKSTENLFYSRAIQANMLNETGNKDGAKAKLTEAFGSVPAGMRAKLLETRPKVVELSNGIGVDIKAMQALPEPTRAPLEAAKPPAVPAAAVDGQPPAAGADKQPPAAVAEKPAGADQPPAGPEKVEAAPAAVEQPAGTDIPKGRQVPVPGADKRFLQLDDAELDKRISDKTGKLEQVEEVKDMYKELIRRYESDLTKAQFAESVPAMKLISDALKAGKDLSGPPEKRVVGTEELSPEMRWNFHRAVFADMETINNQIRIRQEYSQFLKGSEQFADAAKMGEEAREYAERLMKDFDVDGKPVKVIDLMQQEADKLVTDQGVILDPLKRQGMDKASWILIGTNLDNGALKTPINTNKFLAQLYLGTEIIPKLNADGKVVGIQDIQFGKSSAFKPQLALEASNRALDYTRQILKLDPLDAKTAKENPGVASLFGVLAEVVEKPENYKLYVGKEGETFTNEKGEVRTLKGGELVGKNDKGIPILIEAHSVQNLKNQIKKDSTIDSLITNAVLTVGVVSAIKLTRNPKVAEFFEKGLGKYGSHAGVVARVATYSGIATAGVMGRHYGYKAMTGVEESWTDSAVHVVGSVAAAEVGGRLSGRGSFITGSTAGPRQFAKFNETASAEFLKKQGYETTGQVMDLLKSQGFINEAKQFVGMPRGTKLLAEGGAMEGKVLEALQKAELRGARMGSVAEAIMKDAKMSSGVKPDLLAARVAKADAGGLQTVDDLQRLIEADQKALQDLAKHTESAGEKIKVADAVAGHPDAAALLATAEKYGLKDIGAVKSLAATTEKIGFDKVFPKLAEMKSANIITGTTKLTDAVAMGTHALEGPGLQRMLNMVPAGERAGLLTEKALKEVMAASPITGQRSVISRLRDGVGTVKSGFNTVTTREGWNTMRTAAGDVLSPLGTKNFYTQTIPGAAKDGIVFGATKLNDARKVVTGRLEFRSIDPSKATPEALSRARFSSGFYGGLGAAGTYNTVVKPYDMTGQVFGVTLPQYGGDGKPHAIFTNPQGEDMKWMEALRESHFPTITGIDQEKLPWYAKTFVVPLAEAALGTPGQALFGSVFLKPGAIYKPVWSNPEAGPFKKSMQSFFPLSPTRWNNWNAGAFSSPTMATGGIFAGSMLPATIDGAGPRLGVNKYKEMLRNAQGDITNKELPKQRTNLDDLQLPPAAEMKPQEVQPAPVEQVKPAVVPPADATKPAGAYLEERGVAPKKPVVAPRTGDKPLQEEPPPPGSGL